MSTDILVAQMIGTLGCGVAAGGMMTLSVLSIPNLTLPPRQPSSVTILSQQGPGTPIPHLAHQWLDIYERGKRTLPVIALGASVANGYLAWVLRDTVAPDSGIMGGSWTGCYVTAITATMGIVVWTSTVMKSTNDRLTAIATRDDVSVAKGTVVGDQEKARRAKEDAEVPELLKRWTNLNLYRALFPLTGAVIGLYGVAKMKYE
ncbi:hypothetical protein N7466_003930 [Penicillium verhagenii]|uniref:uncharacterized protein n=1 Tax=Penicillium verhagenii TaxID=1562060 RepID=UPI002544F829|nr:uncharacterized protein N7466_003930 [Penicillium verhagenii]KAJ5934383.1 hypothetical protein N7466_003930 [Penicillium verhagenii]